MKIAQGITACKQYCLAAGATQGNIAYTQNVVCNPKKPTRPKENEPNNKRQNANA
jgi:hypothetical protein